MQCCKANNNNNNNNNKCWPNKSHLCKQLFLLWLFKFSSIHFYHSLLTRPSFPFFKVLIPRLAWSINPPSENTVREKSQFLPLTPMRRWTSTTSGSPLWRAESRSVRQKCKPWRWWESGRPPEEFHRECTPHDPKQSQRCSIVPQILHWWRGRGRGRGEKQWTKSSNVIPSHPLHRMCQWYNRCTWEDIAWRDGEVSARQGQAQNTRWRAVPDSGGTDLNGRNPPIAMCTVMLRYQGEGGISRAMFLVRHGASKPPAMFLPRIPPRTVSGNPTVGEGEGYVSGRRVPFLSANFLSYFKVCYQPPQLPSPHTQLLHEQWPPSLFLMLHDHFTYVTQPLSHDTTHR